MAYRDDADALRARIDQLERENGALRRDVAELRGELVPAPSAEGIGERLLGGKVVITLSGELDVMLPPSAHELALETMRSALGSIGETNVVGGTIAWRTGPTASQRIVEIVVTARDGVTRVRIVERLGGLAGGLFGGVVGGAGGGGLGVVVPLLAMLDLTLAMVAAPAWIAGVYAIVRSAYGATARRRERELEVLMRELERVIRSSAAREAAARVRVADEERTDEDGAGDEDAEDGRSAAGERSLRKA